MIFALFFLSFSEKLQTKTSLKYNRWSAFNQKKRKSMTIISLIEKDYLGKNTT